MKTYLVTGGAGFIGSNLTDRLLEDGNNVIVIDNFCSFYDPKLKEKNIEKAIIYNNYKLYREDIRDRRKLNDIFKSNKIDCVVHLAAQAGVRPSIEDPIYYERVNNEGTINLLEEMKNNNVKKFLLASSSSVYGNAKDIPFNENMSTDRCISPYAATKKADEVMSYVYHYLYGMNVIIPRFFTVYGPRQRPDLAISKFTDLIYEGKKIPMYGDGSTFRDYTYIDDIVDGIVKCAFYLDKEDVYEILNLGSSNPITLKKMIEVIAKELNKEPEIEQLDIQKGDVSGTYADITKSKELIGYEPKVSFEEGIKRFVKYYKNNRI